MKALKKTIKVGVVGCGYWGPNLIRNLGQLPDCQLKVICDASEKRLSHMRRLNPGVATTSPGADTASDESAAATRIESPPMAACQMSMCMRLTEKR